MTSFVFVHGGFTDGWYWGETAALLEKEGHRVHVAELPSTGTDPVALTGLAEDAAEVRRIVEAAAEPVVLVGHSYGGMVLTELADHPGAAHAVYLSAFWPERGQSLLAMIGGALPPILVAREDGTVQITDDVDAAVSGLCAELPADRVPEWTAHNLLSSGACFGAPSTAPDRGHPTTYIVLDRDQAFPPQAQEAMAARADHVERMATSHQAMLADPEGLAAVLGRVR
jgi:Predicted hydrolases or acyltransferases (alpha/beta hydrolase superfamily)